MKSTLRPSDPSPRVSDVTEQLSAPQARRIFLAAQGLAGRRPRRTPRAPHFAAYLERQGIVQLDSVNVLARAHYLPFFSRMGPYDRAALDSYLWSADTFEHWGHEASVMRRDLLPAMHHRMMRPNAWKAAVRDELERERPGLLQAVVDAVAADGPLTAGELEHLAPRSTPKGSWWDHGHVKTALEYLFITGGVAAGRLPTFARTYDSTDRGWGVPPAADGDWGLTTEAAYQVLFDRALAATAIGTPRDLADHFRLLAPRIFTAANTAPLAASAVERGLASWVTVDGWAEPALLARGAEQPARVGAAALLSPFDPVCWYRPRLERMFAVDYRIEIYTPAPKRIYGYYCLPFLLGDQIVARVDLKADRAARTLIAAATWREARTAPGARRRADGEVASALAAELATMAEWLGLDCVRVEPLGDLSAALLASPATT